MPPARTSSSTMLNGVLLNGARVGSCTVENGDAKVCLSNGAVLERICAGVYGVPFTENDDVASVSPFHFVNTSVLLKSPVFVQCAKKHLHNHAFIGTVTYVEQPVDEEDDAEDDEEEDDLAGMSGSSDDENSDDENVEAELPGIDSEEDDEMSDFE